MSTNISWGPIQPMLQPICGNNARGVQGASLQLAVISAGSVRQKPRSPSPLHTENYHRDFRLYLQIERKALFQAVRKGMGGSSNAPELQGRGPSPLLLPGG